MPRPRNSCPKLSFHKPSGLYYLRLGGKVLYLGKDRLTAEAERVRLLAEAQAGVPVPVAPAQSMTVAEAMNTYRDHVRPPHVKHGRLTSEYYSIGAALRPLRRLYGHLPLYQLTMATLLTLRHEIASHGCAKQREAGRGCSPSVTNQHMGRVTRFLRWCANRGYCPASLWHEAQALDPLRVERAPLDGLDVDPPPTGAVEATLPFCSPVLAAMIRFALLTGARPGEVCALTPAQLDRTGVLLKKLLGETVELAGCWAYLPSEHKTEHHGHLRLIPVGPLAQEVLSPLLAGRADHEPVFSPVESYRWFRAQQRQRRKTRVQPSQVSRAQASSRARKRQWTSHGFAQAVDQAIERARKGNVVIEHWHPNQLRHAAASLLVDAFGWEVARLVLGHTSVSTTRIYVKDNATKAFRAMSTAG